MPGGYINQIRDCARGRENGCELCALIPVRFVKLTENALAFEVPAPSFERKVGHLETAETAAWPTTGETGSSRAHHGLPILLH
jgi:hypothetical protein